jgi:hypothetical protein
MPMLSHQTLTKDTNGRHPDRPVRWENPATRRYYRAIVQQNLWGDWELYCVWGGIGSQRGNSKAIPASSGDDARLKLAALTTRRLKRHYRQVTP